MESKPTASKEKARAALDAQINARFTELGFTQIGSKDSQGRVITAQSIVERFRVRTEESATKETQTDAFTGLLITYDVPAEKAIQIALLWGARYGVFNEKDFPFSFRLDVGNESSATFISPLSIHRKPVKR